MWRLGSSHPKKTNTEDNIRFNTVCHHKQGGKYNLNYMSSSKTFTCFSGCSDSFDIYELVIRNHNLNHIKLTFYDAVNFVAEVTGRFIGQKRTKGFGKPNYIIDDWDFIDGYNIKTTQATIYEEFNDNVLNCFDEFYHQSWIDDGISINTMKKYNIRYNIKDHQIIIPHYGGLSGKLIGIRARNLLPDPLSEGRKYMPIYLQGRAFNHSLGGNLYGLDKNRETIQKLKKIMIVESEKGVMQVDTMYGGHNFTVASCSSNITNIQRDLILGSDVNEVILAPDKDFELDSPEYEKKMKSISKLALKFAPFMRVYVLEDHQGLLGLKDSPTDRGKDTLESLMRDKVELTISMINNILQEDTQRK